MNFVWVKIDWMRSVKNDVHPLILSSAFHYEFVFIHPFSDGNGRMARLWHTVMLAKWKPVFEYIPIESQIEKFQDDYYEAIAKSHVAGESTIFIEFMLSQIDKILDEITVQINEENEYLSETVKKMLAVMEYDIPYTSKTLMERLGLKSREGFRRNYLHPAIELNLIRMTIPDKPNSRNQRYIKNKIRSIAMQKILVVEDDQELNQALCYALEKEGYAPVPVFSIEEAKLQFQKLAEKHGDFNAVSFLIQDVNLPDGEGFELCRWIKEQAEMPVLFLTARDLEEDVLKGYDLGAEDYVTKPFSMKILLRKIELILRRTQPEQSKGYNDGYLRIDWEQVKVIVDQKECALTPTEFRLLKLLAENKGRLLTYEILLEQLWDCDGQFVDKHTLAVNINRLRRKLENAEHKYISNVYGMGYQWIG